MIVRAWVLRTLLSLSVVTCMIVACTEPPEDASGDAPDATLADGTPVAPLSDSSAPSPADVRVDVADLDANDSDVVDGGSDPPDVREAEVPIADPLLVRCGASSCNTGAGAYELCCLVDAGTCVTSQSQCSGPYVAKCDEAADCLTGQACCSTPTSVGLNRRFGSTCLPDNAGICEFNGGVQLCKTEAECHGATCTEKACDGRSFFSCGPLPPGFCP